MFRVTAGLACAASTVRRRARVMVPISRAFAGVVEHTSMVGTQVPDVTVHAGFPDPLFNVREKLAGKNVVLIPGYLDEQEALKARGVDDVLIVSVNDGAVMMAWADDQGVHNSMMQFLADPNAELVKALDVELTHPGPVAVLGPHRSKRFAAYVEDGTIKAFRISEGEGDPAGDNDPTGTCVEAMLEVIDQVKTAEL